MGSIGGLDTGNLALIADYSHWNGNIDLALTKVDFAWFKACDGKQIRSGDAYDLSNYVDDTLHTNIQKAYDLKIPCGVYIYVQHNFPNWTTQSIAEWHYKVFKRATASLVPGKSFHAIALDVEERGASAPNMAAIVLTLHHLIADDPAFAGIPIFIYTSMSVLNIYTNLREQISYKGSNYNGMPYYLWLAQWAWNATPRITTNWDELRSKYLANLTMRVSTPGYAVWTMCQIAANFVLPGCTVNITDISVFAGARDKLYALLNYSTTTPPPTEPPGDDTNSDTTITKTDFDALVARVVELERWRKS